MDMSSVKNKYVRLCKTVQTKGDLILLEELTQKISESPNSSWYTSIYNYGTEAKEYFDKNQSIAGFAGEAWSNKLVFDFDCKENVDLARKDTIRLLNKLAKSGLERVDEHVVVYFSGHKGFHVEVPLNVEFAPAELKKICTNIAGEFQTFDPVIYNTTRLYRLFNTQHEVTGLYKIAFRPKQFGGLTLDQIKELAKSPGKPVDNKLVEHCEFLEQFKTNKEEKKQYFDNVVTNPDSNKGIRGLDTIDFSKCPSGVPRCIYALQHGIMIPGERSRVFFRLATYFRNQGFSKEVTASTLEGISDLNQKLYPEYDAIDKNEIIYQHVASAYTEASLEKQNPGSPGTSPENELIEKYCKLIASDKDCWLHKNSHSVVKINDISDDFSNFAENYDKNRVFTGIKFIDDNMNISIGTTTLLVGASGTGKTTACINILEQSHLLNQHAMFFSMDMHKNIMFIKLATKVTSYTQEEVINFYKNRDEKKKQEIKEAINNSFGNISFDFSSTLTMEQLKQRVQAQEQRTGNKIKLAMVDYASRITGPYSDRYANATYNALKSVELAKDTDAAWIYLSQISRSTGDGSNPIRTKRAAKESGDWEETSSNVITMWRPFMGKEGKDDIIRMFMAKNRMGPELERPLWWDGAKGLIRSMTEDEHEWYQNEREQEEIELIKSKINKKIN